MPSRQTSLRKRAHAFGLRLLAGLALLGTATNAMAQQDAFAPPLPMNNRTPFTLLFMAPTAPDYTLASGQQQFSMQLDLSSHSLIESAGDTLIELDGETLRIALNWQHRLSERLILQAEVPWISHSGGFLDSVIDGWHSLTGLPDGERDRQPSDRLLFGYQNAQQTVLTQARQQGLGDVILSSAFRLDYRQSQEAQGNARHSSWVQLGVKLPTGSGERLTGSGATDVAASLHHYREWQAGRLWSLSADAYVVHAGRSDVIQTQKDTQWLVTLKAATRWSDRLAPELQLRYRSAAYTSAVDAVGSKSLGIDVGVTLRVRRGYWKLGFSEDIDVDSAPDVGFYAQYMHRRGGRRHP